MSTYHVRGMTCAACASHVEKAAKSVPGVESAQVNLMNNTLRVEGEADAQRLSRAISNAGYQLVLGGARDDADKAYRAHQKRLWISVALLTLLMYVSMGHMVGLPLPAFFALNMLYQALLQLALTLPILWVNRVYFTRGFAMLFRLAPNMDSLIAVGATAAMIYSVYISCTLFSAPHTHNVMLYYESAAMIVTLVTVGKTLEQRARGKTGAAIEKLMTLAPETACVIRGGKEEIIPVSQVRIDDEVLVRPGQRVPVDGVVTQGASGVDESALTGEPLPREIHEGDSVLSASMNKTGTFAFRATRVGEDTTISQIIRLVSDAAGSKAPIARLADNISAVFVPVVLGLSLVTAVVWLLCGAEVSFALTAAVAVLVVSCPCALGLATPVAVMVGTGVGAEKGILFRSAEALETAQRAQIIALDKTGTLTKGQPRVTDIITVNGQSEADVLQTALSLEVKSEHPLAEAITKRAEGLPALDVQNFSALPGRGIRGDIDGKPCLAGSARLMEEEHIDVAGVKAQTDALYQDGKTLLYIAKDGRLHGVMAVADELKPDSAQAVRDIRKLGREVVLLTGDNKRAAEAIARIAGIDRVMADVLPQDKEKAVRELQQRARVMMVGDGVNDAPALARADIGAAVSQGSDIAIDSADIVLMRGSLTAVPDAIRLSHAVMRNIKTNLFWAFFYNALGIPLAAGVFYSALGWLLSPMYAAAAMSLSSVCVVLNALRLRRFDKRHTREKTRHAVIEVGGMTCEHCVRAVREALEKVPGVERADVRLKTNKASVTLRGDTPLSALKDAIENEDYTVGQATER